MENHSVTPRWAPYTDASRFSGLSSRLLEDLVKDELIVSALARRPGCARGIRLIDLHSLDAYIRSGIGAKTDMAVLKRKPEGNGGADA